MPDRTPIPQYYLYGRLADDAGAGHIEESAA